MSESSRTNQISQGNGQIGRANMSKNYNWQNQMLQNNILQSYAGQTKRIVMSACRSDGWQRRQQCQCMTLIVKSRAQRAARRMWITTAIKLNAKNMIKRAVATPPNAQPRDLNPSHIKLDSNRGGVATRFNKSLIGVGKMPAIRKRHERTKKNQSVVKMQTVKLGQLLDLTNAITS